MTASTSIPVLVMGAGGRIGSHVLAGLLARGVPVRASARDPKAHRFPPGVDVVAADLGDPAGLARAFDGVGRVFLFAHHEGVHGVVDAARGAGVERIVLLSSGSVVHPASAGNAIAEEHRAVEAAFAAAADLEVIPIRPLVLATNALAWSHAIRARADLPLYRPEARTAPVHERDVAAVAVAALLGQGDGAVSGMLTGPERLSQREQAEAIGRAVGRGIPIQELDRTAAGERLARVMPPAEAGAVLAFLDDAAAGNSPATSVVESVLGRPAIGFGAWAADHAADFA